MATIKIEVVAGAQTTTKQVTVSNGDLMRFIAAYRSVSGMGAEPTDAQVVTEWATGVLVEARKMTKRSEAKSTAEITMT